MDLTNEHRLRIFHNAYLELERNVRRALHTQIGDRAQLQQQRASALGLLAAGVTV